MKKKNSRSPSPARAAALVPMARRFFYPVAFWCPGQVWLSRGRDRRRRRRSHRRGCRWFPLRLSAPAGKPSDAPRQSAQRFCCMLSERMLRQPEATRRSMTEATRRSATRRPAARKCMPQRAASLPEPAASRLIPLLLHGSEGSWPMGGLREGLRQDSAGGMQVRTTVQVQGPLCPWGDPRTIPRTIPRVPSDDRSPDDLQTRACSWRQKDLMVEVVSGSRGSFSNIMAQMPC